MKSAQRVVIAGMLLLSWLSAGCSTAVAPAVEIVPTPTNTLAATARHIETPTSTAQPDLTRLTFDCADILDTVPSGMKLKGSLVLDSIPGGLSILNLETQAQTTLADSGRLVYSGSVSPDRQRLAYSTHTEDSKIVIADVNAQTLGVLDGFDRYMHLIGWLDNENIVLDRAEEQEEPFYHYSLVILNTLTNDRTEFGPAEFPDGELAYTGGGGFNWGHYSHIVPNASLSRFVFPEAESWDGILLWDAKARSVVRKIYSPEHSFTPLWTPGGTDFIISAPLYFDDHLNFSDALPYLGGSELLLVGADGDVERLTFVTTKYRRPDFSVPAWSPAAEQVAFNLHLSPDNHAEHGLSILDLKTQEITNYCIEDNSSYIFWSPDGNQIAFTLGNGSDPAHPKAYVLDLASNMAFKVADDATIVGWMVNDK